MSDRVASALFFASEAGRAPSWRERAAAIQCRLGGTGSGSRARHRFAPANPRRRGGFASGLVGPDRARDLFIRGARLPETTAKATEAEGWLHKGDASFLDAKGFLTISDPIKDMIITGGENVYPAVIEIESMRHPSIAEVRVIGEPDGRRGEQVVAVVALKPGATPTLVALRAFADERLAAYKQPRRLELVAAQRDGQHPQITVAPGAREARTASMAGGAQAGPVSSARSGATRQASA